MRGPWNAVPRIKTVQKSLPLLYETMNVVCLAWPWYRKLKGFDSTIWQTLWCLISCTPIAHVPTWMNVDRGARCSCEVLEIIVGTSVLYLYLRTTVEISFYNPLQCLDVLTFCCEVADFCNTHRFASIAEHEPWFQLLHTTSGCALFRTTNIEPRKRHQRCHIVFSALPTYTNWKKTAQPLDWKCWGCIVQQELRNM